MNAIQAIASYARRKTHQRRNQKICLCRKVNFDRALRTAPDELEYEPYMIGKLRMFSFQILLRFVHIYFLDEVMTVLMHKGHAVCESDFQYGLIF